MLTNSITDKLYVCIVPSTEGKRRKKEKEKKKITELARSCQMKFPFPSLDRNFTVKSKRQKVHL